MHSVEPLEWLDVQFFHKSNQQIDLENSKTLLPSNNIFAKFVFVHKCFEIFRFTDNILLMGANRCLMTLLDNWIEYVFLCVSLITSQWMIGHFIFGFVVYATVFMVMFEQGMVNGFHHRFVGEAAEDPPAERAGGPIRVNFNYELWFQNFVERIPAWLRDHARV